MTDESELVSLQLASTRGVGDSREILESEWVGEGGCVSSESVSQFASISGIDSLLLVPNTSVPPDCNAQKEKCTRCISTQKGRAHALQTQMWAVASHHLQRKPLAAGSGDPLLAVPVAIPHVEHHTDGGAADCLLPVAAATTSHDQIEVCLLRASSISLQVPVLACEPHEVLMSMRQSFQRYFDGSLTKNKCYVQTQHATASR